MMEEQRESGDKSMIDNSEYTSNECKEALAAWGKQIKAYPNDGGTLSFKHIKCLAAMIEDLKTMEKQVND
jgi:hypothetical protein